MYRLNFAFAFKRKFDGKILELDLKKLAIILDKLAIFRCPVVLGSKNGMVLYLIVKFKDPLLE